MKRTEKIVGISVLAVMLAGGLGYSLLYGTAEAGGEASLNDAEASENTAAVAENTTETSESIAAASKSTAASATDEVAAVSEDAENAMEESMRADAVWITLDQDGSAVSGSGASVSDNTITVSSGGYYWISGSLEDGQIYVDADGSDSVVLMLAGMELLNESEAAIYVENAGSTTIYLVSGTENRIQSGTDTGSAAANGEADDTAEGGAIYARDDLILSGTGMLTVTGFLNNGIQTSNNLTIENGAITVDAVNNGIKGKDSVTILGGTIVVTSGGDGIKSDDTTGDGYGVISIEGGVIQIESGTDGMQAETVLAISDGELQIVSGQGSADAETVSNDFGFGMGGFAEGWDMEDEDAESIKGIKSGVELLVSGGEITVDSYDDSLHSNGSITISGGSITVAAGDDGVHADAELTVSDGCIEVTQSYEGLEGNQIYIEGGDIQITATDDGINAYGGSGTWGTSGKTTEETPLLLITGGTLYVDAQGDGLDSNADLTIEGGTIVVDGPSDSMNGAIDSGYENGGVCSISGGTILAVGAAGMAETFSSSSSQCSFLYSLSANYAAGSVITICDADGNVLFEHTSARSFSSIVFSSPELEQDGTYQISIDEETSEITLTSVSGSYSGQMSGTYGDQMGGNQIGGGFGGRMGGNQMGGNQMGGGVSSQTEGEAGGQTEEAAGDQAEQSGGEI